MSHRTISWIFASSAFLFLFQPLTPAWAQGPRAAAKTVVSKAIPRTPDGRPDLQGVWNNSSLTPLERLREFEGKQTVTEA